MTNLNIRPEDAFPMDQLVGVAEVNIFPPNTGVTGAVPTRKNKRCVYTIIVSDLSGVANWIEIRVYSALGVLERVWRIPLVINDTLPMLNQMNHPLLEVPAGKILRAIAGVASVRVHMMAYDI
jgi:hypothetical protein